MRPDGEITRGTTNPSRLRRVDRWITQARLSVLRAATRPLIVDLGFGASPVTTFELYRRIRTAVPEAEVTGLEIDPDRVAAARRRPAAACWWRTREVCQRAGADGGFVMSTGIGEMEGCRPDLVETWIQATREFGAV